MFYHLKEMLEEFAELDVRETANFKAIIRLRTALYEKGIDREFAGEIAIRVNVQLNDVDDEQIDQLIDPLATIVYNLTEALLTAGFSRTGVLEGIATQLELKLG